MNKTNNTDTARHVNLSSQYDCEASLTTAEFTHMGKAYIARRFYRADIGTRGIELYTLVDGIETPVRNRAGKVRMVAEQGAWRKLDRRAAYLIQGAIALYNHAGSAERGSLLEMD